MKDIIFIGQSGSGKTTLCQRIHDEELRYKKTQAIACYPASIDTPGEYLENRRFTHALLVTASDARLIGLVSDPTNPYRAIPPGFGTIFGKKVIGIVTKIYSVPREKVEAARQELLRAQASPIFEVDTPENKGISELMEYLNTFHSEAGGGT